MCLPTYDGYHLEIGKTYNCNEDGHLSSVKIEDKHVKHFQLITDKPTHYQTESDFDVIDISQLYKLNLCEGSAVKYVCRAGKKLYEGKNETESKIEDYKKAIDFLQREIKHLENE